MKVTLENVLRYPVLRETNGLCTEELQLTIARDLKGFDTVTISMPFPLSKWSSVKCAVDRLVVQLNKLTTNSCNCPSCVAEEE